MRSYYIFPIKESEPIATIGIYEGVKKVEEIDVCIGKPCDFLSWIDVTKYSLEKLHLKVEKGDADLELIYLSKQKPSREGNHPLIHYTPAVGWMNDLNGLIVELFSSTGFIYCVEKANGCKIDIKKTTIKSGTLELYRLAAIHCAD